MIIPFLKNINQDNLSTVTAEKMVKDKNVISLP